MIRRLENIFSASPLLFFEIVRILAGKSVCVLPQQVFEIKGFNALRLLNSAFSYISKDLSKDRLLKEIDYIESEVSNFLKSDELAKILERVGMKVLPFCTLVDRILSFKETPIFPSIYCYVYAEDEENYVKNILAEVRCIEVELLNSNSLEKRLKIVRKEGELLGYPRCCINEFVRLKREAILKKSLTPETKVILELLDVGFLDSMPKLVESMNIGSFEYLYSLFSLNFYPCSIFCKRAIEIGKTCEDFLNQTFKKAYRCGLFFNAFYHLVTGYNLFSCGKYLERISNYYSNLRTDIKEVLDTSKNVVTDVKFINAFINNCNKSN